ncbi:hypothetical protein [Pseudonocardia nigra]|nr:hypothetical protein [Pseudonocardia nigra]
MTAMPITLDIRPLDDDIVEHVENLDTLVETVMCSCSAGDDQPY